jgi:membrane-bound lytic murein transglycosylase D
MTLFRIVVTFFLLIFINIYCCWGFACLDFASGIQHSAFNIQHSAFNIHHSALNIHHSALNIHHSSFIIQNSKDTLPKDTLIHNSEYKIQDFLDSLSKLWSVKEHFTNSPTHQLTNSPTHQLTNSPTHQLTNSPTHQLTNSPTHQLSDREYSRRFSAIRSDIRLIYNNKVKKYIETYLFDKRYQTQIMIGLFGNYLPAFDRIMAQKHLPEDLKYLPMAESALFNNAKSPSGAAGIWQLSFSSAIHYGLIVNSFIDERKDPEKSAIAAATCLKDLYDVYNDWLLAIAAYNSSPSIVNKAIRRAKGKMDFWSVYENLPSDSREYIPAFIAAVYVMNYYKDYGLKPFPINLPSEADTVAVSEQLHFKQISSVLKIPLLQISEMNPIYKLNIIPPTSGFRLPASSFLVLPCGYGEKFYALRDSIYKYRDSTITSFFKLYQASDLMPQASDLITQSSELIYYIVKTNDNLAKIAKSYNVTVSDLKKWNHLRSKPLKKGQKLKIYFTVKGKPETQNPELKTHLKPDTVLKSDTSKVISPKPLPLPVHTAGDYIIYKVREGDSFYKIANTYGVTVKDILELNSFDDTTIIKPGQVIKIKKTQ